MPFNAANVLVGAAVASISPWVTAAGAGTFVDLGHLHDKVTFGGKYTDLDVKSQNSFGKLRKVPTDAEFTVKIALKEATGANYLMALRQPIANQTGTAPNLITKVGQPVETYYQLKLVVPGVGTTKTKTIIFWKVIVASIGDVAFDKNGEQVHEVTFEVCWDDTVPTADHYFQITEA